MNRPLFILFSLILWGFLSCSSKVEDSSSVDGATSSSFIVGIFKVSTTEETGMNPISTLKRGKVINFTSCLKDATYLSAIQNQNFVVSGGNEEIRVKTDHNSCIHWSEQITIDNLESMGYVETSRTITGVGNYTGSVTIPLAIKIRENGPSAVIDLRYHDIPRSTNAAKARDEEISFVMGEVEVSPAISIMSQEDLMEAYRRIQVQISAVIMDSEGNGVSNHPFKMVFTDDPDFSKIDWDKVSVTQCRDTSGKHITSSMVEYKRFAGEYYMQRFIVVKSMEAPFKDVIKAREVYINPWQWWGRFFFWDSKWDVPGQVPLHKKAEKRTPQLMVQEIALSYTGNDENSYSLNQYMDLTFKKNYQITFRPCLNRKMSYRPGYDGAIYERIHIAQLKAKLVLVRPKNGVLDLKKLEEQGIKGLDDYEYVTGTEVLLEVKEGLAQDNFSFEFDFRQTPFMVTRSLLLAEIGPADPEWDVEPVVVTITMKAGEFWITEGALFATELFTGNGDEGIGVFRDGIPVEEEHYLAYAAHPAVDSGNFAETSPIDNSQIPFTSSVSSQAVVDSKPRYLFTHTDDESQVVDELSRIPEHLRLKDRLGYWSETPKDIFLRTYRESAKVEEFNFHAPSFSDLAYHDRYVFPQAWQKFESFDYLSEERLELERNVGKQALYELSVNRDVFESFLSDPTGIQFAKYIKEECWKGPFAMLWDAIRGHKVNYLGGSQKFAETYADIVTKLIHLFYHDEMVNTPFHILTSSNPLDYLKITPLTFLTEKPVIRNERGEDVPLARKILSGRDEIPIKLGMSDIFGMNHSTSHSWASSFRLSPRDLVTGSLANVAALGNLASGAGGVVLGGVSGMVSGGTSWSKNKFRELGQKKDVGLTSGFNLLIDQLLLEFEAESQSCLLIEASIPEYQGDYFYYQQLTDSDVYLVCLPEKNQRKKFREMWYFINTATTDSTHFVDHNNLANRPIVMPLRGLRNFVSFRNSLVNQTENFIVMEKEVYEPLARRALKDIFNVDINDIPSFLTDGEFPGAVPWDYDGTIKDLYLSDVTQLGIFGEPL